MKSKPQRRQSRWFYTANRPPQEHLAEVYCLIDGHEVEAWWASNGLFLRRSDGAILESKRWRYR